MITLLFGENTGVSRQKLQELQAVATSQNKTIIHLDAKKLSIPDLEEVFGSTGLFGDERVIVIEELHSLPKSARQNQLFDLIKQAEADTELILWEKRALTPTMIKRWSKPILHEFKLSSVMFKWLESIQPIQGSPQNTAPKNITLFHQTLVTEDEHLCFIMLARQVRLLIQVKAGEQPKGPPFMISKLAGQSKLFTLEQLIATHTRLLEIDRRLKTGAARLNLTQELDLLLLEL
jgi:DNA polymerase III delta subunit